jgi:hypothetical protein
MKTNELINQITTSIISANNKMDQEIARIKKNNEMQKLFLAKVNEVVPLLVGMFTKENLEIVSLSTHKIGDSDWKDTDYMHVSLSLKPISEKFKFIKFAGYTKSGSDKNREVLMNRASKLSEKIKLATGLTSVNVNQYSFEIKNDSDIEKKSILVEFWVK